MDQKQHSQDNNTSQHEHQQQNHEQYNETARQRTVRVDTSEQASYYSQQQDVRMKRHPELQPYVPSDRYNRIVPKTSSKTSSSSMTTSSSGLPKKYCSMSRLNQLAQPKNNNKKAMRDSQEIPQRQPPQKQQPLKQQPQRQHQQQQPKPQQPKPGHKQQQQQHHHQQQQQQQKQHQSHSQQQQQQQQQHHQRRLSDRPHPITPITSAKPTTMITPLSPTSAMPTQTPKSSTPVVRTPRDTPSTPAVQLPTPASSLEEELDVANKTRDIVSIVSEMSINDPFYQSAASELVPDSEKSNGNNFDRNADSLCREFEQDLIAKGILKETADADNDNDDEFRSPMSNGKNDSLRRTSAATIVTSDNLAQSGGGGEEQQNDNEGYDEDDRRLKIEKELREKAKKEDDDRKEREQLVESILSRFSQGSVS